MAGISRSGGVAIHREAGKADAHLANRHYSLGNVLGNGCMSRCLPPSLAMSLSVAFEQGRQLAYLGMRVARPAQYSR